MPSHSATGNEQTGPASRAFYLRRPNIAHCPATMFNASPRALRGKSMEETPKQTADRRNELAADRTVFAAERTYAAWVRTGLAALASGVGAKKLLEGVIPEWGLWAVGTVLVLFSAFCFGAAVWRQVFSGALPPQP